MIQPPWKILVVLILLSSVGIVAGQDKKPDKKDGPRVLVALPLGVKLGATTKVTVRGLKLDAATGVRFADDKVKAKLLGKGKAAVPNMQEPARVGDTQVEVEVTVPAEIKGDLSFTVITPAGETAPHTLLVESSLPLVPEKEPNNGLRTAQPIPAAAVVEGGIGQGQDVDVFRVESKAGQKLTAEVFAARHGSALDPILTVYDENGRQLGSNDDADGRDSRVEVVLPKDGAYLVSLIDAHDQGGPVHVYRLRVQVR